MFKECQTTAGSAIGSSLEDTFISKSILTTHSLLQNGVRGPLCCDLWLKCQIKILTTESES